MRREWRSSELGLIAATLIVADTLRLAEGYIEVKPLGLVPVKGLEAPIEVYGLTGARRLRTWLDPAARGLTRFMGREGELDQPPRPR